MQIVCLECYVDEVPKFLRKFCNVDMDKKGKRRVFVFVLVLVLMLVGEGQEVGRKWVKSVFYKPSK